MTIANGILSASRQAAVAGHVILGFVAATALASAAVAEPNNTVPQFASAEFGWQTNVGDWRDPPPGHGHGPIKPDPAHPFTSNAEAADRKSTRLNSSHSQSSYAVFCLKKKKK